MSVLPGRGRVQIITPPATNYDVNTIGNFVRRMIGAAGGQTLNCPVPSCSMQCRSSNTLYSHLGTTHVEMRRRYECPVPGCCGQWYTSGTTLTEWSANFNLFWDHLKQQHMATLQASVHGRPQISLSDLVEREPIPFQYVDSQDNIIG